MTKVGSSVGSQLTIKKRKCLYIISIQKMFKHKEKTEMQPRTSEFSPWFTHPITSRTNPIIETLRIITLVSDTYIKMELLWNMVETKSSKTEKEQSVQSRFNKSALTFKKSINFGSKICTSYFSTPNT